MNAWIVFFTLRVAALSTLLIFPIALLLAVLTPRLPARLRIIVETLGSLPLILPPTAVGFLLLELLSRQSWVGAGLAAAGIEILFTPAAVVLATAVMSFPLMFRSFRVAFESVPHRYVDVARTLGATPVSAFVRVVFPLAWRGVLSGILLAYCRAIGEFGATIVIAGNIPRRTQTLALGIYQHIQSGRQSDATQLLIVSVLIGTVAVMSSELLMRRQLRSG